MLEADGCWKFTERAQQAQEAVSCYKLQSCVLLSTHHSRPIRSGRKFVQEISPSENSPSHMDRFSSEHISTEAPLRLGISRWARTASSTDSPQKPSSKTRRSNVLFRTYCRQCVVREHLKQLAGVGLLEATPFTDKYDGMFVRWDNYDIEERHDDIEEDGSNVEEVVSILQRAMSKCEQTPKRSGDMIGM